MTKPLDLIALNRGLTSIRDALGEARAFLSMPPPETPCPAPGPIASAKRGSSEAARRLFAMSRPIAGTLAEVYLRRRGVDPSIADTRALRFHPRCYYREADDGPSRTYPALIAAVTDAGGALTGAHRTRLDPTSPGDKAPVSSPRGALGALLGAGVRFGAANDAGPSVLAAGEGLETIMSLRMAMPDLPMIAALSANHLAALTFPSRLGRLYVAVDPDRAGRGGMERLSRRAREAGIEVFALSPRRGDFNEDLRRVRPHALLRNLGDQLVPGDAARFLGAA